MLHRTTVSSPLGELRLVASDHGIRQIGLPLPEHDSPPPAKAIENPDHPVLRETHRQLDEYFRGERTTFDLPLDVVGTEFQRQVWSALSEIPHGETASYGQIAERIGRPGSARAVGAANGRNPVPLLVPCHRVIGADGAMVGYGGPAEEGLEMKRWLLRHEGIDVRKGSTAPALF